MTFAPVATLEELDALDEAEILEGYMSAAKGDPEPGDNRGRAYWHGWRCRMIDYGVIPNDEIHRALATQIVRRDRGRS